MIFLKLICIDVAVSTATQILLHYISALMEAVAKLPRDGKGTPWGKKTLNKTLMFGGSPENCSKVSLSFHWLCGLFSQT